MSSGLTKSTAYIAQDEACKSWGVDKTGMRPFGNCSIVIEPSFGILDIDWEGQTVSLQHRTAADGEIAIAADGSRQELIVDLATCKMVGN